MKKITKEEKQWMEKLEWLLCNPPSKRLGLFTIGDPFLMAYDKTYDSKIDVIQDRDNVDFCQVVDDLGCGLGTIGSAIQIHSTAG